MYIPITNIFRSHYRKQQTHLRTREYALNWVKNEKKMKMKKNVIIKAIAWFFENVEGVEK